MWGSASPADKKPFEAMHVKDQARFEKQKKELEEKGYFIMIDGTKSTDHMSGKKKSRRSPTKDKVKKDESKGKERASLKKRTSAEAKSKATKEDLKKKSATSVVKQTTGGAAKKAGAVKGKKSVNSSMSGEDSQ